MAQLDLDTDILVRFRNGDEKALAYIFKLYHKGLCYFARQLVNEDQPVEDIVAEAFVKLWQKHTDFATLNNIKAFLYVSTRHSCYNYLKHIQRKTASHQEILHLAETDEDYIESRMIKAELLQIILLEVENLPPIRRKIFKMIYLEDLSIFEIATRLNITVDTVRVQKARAIHGIRTIILKKGILLVACEILMGLFFF